MVYLNILHLPLEKVMVILLQHMLPLFVKGDTKNWLKGNYELDLDIIKQMSQYLYVSYKLVCFNFSLGNCIHPNNLLFYY